MYVMRLPALRAFGYSFSAHQRHGPSDYHIKCFNVSRDRIQIHQKHLAVRPPYELPLRAFGMSTNGGPGGGRGKDVWLSAFAIAQ